MPCVRWSFPVHWAGGSPPRDLGETTIVDLSPPDFKIAFGQVLIPSGYSCNFVPISGSTSWFMFPFPKISVHQWWKSRSQGTGIRNQASFHHPCPSVLSVVKIHGIGLGYSTFIRQAASPRELGRRHFVTSALRFSNCLRHGSISPHDIRVHKRPSLVLRHAQPPR